MHTASNNEHAPRPNLWLERKCDTLHGPPSVPRLPLSALISNARMSQLDA